ncbi:hypothetical protein [Amycolatopsis kentuckyensis]|uniref:hypothetical protein n=1 Tax=Amycolatopsis kentuckyensis TaxID=218823 RepID=UPI003563952D
MQITLPIFTAVIGGFLGLSFGRLNKALDRRQERKDADAKRAPDFQITPELSRQLRLTNVGTYDATGVVVDLGDFPKGFVRDLPNGIDLAKGASVTFLVMGTMGVKPPDDALVSCDQLASPRPVALPRPAPRR